MPNLYTTKQIEAARMLRDNDGGIAWWRVGEGKTRIIYLWFATIAKSLRVSNPIFIVVCRRKAFDDWYEEAKFKLKFDWTVCNYETYTWPSPRNKPTVLLVSHGMLHKILPDLMEYTGVLESVAYDEGFLYKNSQTKLCKSANKLSDAVGKAAVVSGSIMTAKNVEDMYGQTYAINKHTAVARTLTEFRSKFQFSLSLDPDQPFGRKLILAKRNAKAKILKRIAAFTHKYFPKSKRQTKHIERHIHPTLSQSKAINSLKGDYLLEIDGHYVEIKNKLSLIIKCQQISDGWLKSEGGMLHEIPSEKLDYLMEMLETLIEAGEKIIIWCAFKESVKRVLQRLQKQFPKLKNTFYELTGGKQFNLQGWRKHGRIVVATEDSGSSVDCFSGCAYAIYFSMSWKWLSLQQSRGRSDRKSSTQAVSYYYYLFTQSSLDEFVYRTAVASGKAEQEIIDYKFLIQWLNTAKD